MGNVADSQRIEQRQPSRSVRLFLVDGSWHGIVIADVGNWNGKVLAGPRSRLPELLRRPEAARTGVYVLLGPDPDRVDGQLAYIGETDDIAARMRNHLRSEAKDFFERIAFLVSSDETLTKAHVRYLESRLIKLTQEAGSVTLINDTQPDFRRLPEADRADMEAFIAHTKLIFPILGCDLFRPQRSVAVSADAIGGDTPPNHLPQWILAAVRGWQLFNFNKFSVFRYLIFGASPFS